MLYEVITTLPQWRLAHPFRYLAHNGEINTIQGNRNWANARAYKFKSEHLPDVEAIKPRITSYNVCYTKLLR